ncbi:MAG: galactoside ABC transporter permease, partial [Spirochaetales bacterium]|nr:galactoside ABC transporter permease [Spirochaetales bacterium]
RTLRNGKTQSGENIALNFKNYIYDFKTSTFFLQNGLYLAIAIFFITCIIVAPLTGNGHLLTLPNIFTLLEQASTRMFYALGVAVLILQAGTDLSVGRMVAIGAITTGLILHPGPNIVTFMGMGPWDFTAIPIFLRLSMALIISIVLCTLFSLLAGFFSAKFKIHPFISTLATQLIIYGLLFFGTSGTPVGSIDHDVKTMIGGRWTLGIVNGELVTFPKLIIPAIIAIVVSWFIWNKTTFGKNMYAVGGNPEAASVSGISVFKVTMGVFAMAGIFYGCGAFLEAFKANASAGTGQGYELDAIAACVVGGISFFGGIGKIKGAVIGVIIFTGLTYCLTFLGIDTNLQFVFKGCILLTAVTLDSVKYITKK